MSKMGEKVAYLKGLAQGLGVDAQSEQGKLMLAMIDTLEAFAQHNEELEERLAELSEYVEEIDSDVSDLEEALFSEEEEDFDEDADDEEDDEDGNTDGMIEYECPHCGTVIFFDEDAFDMEEEHLCPNCHRKVFEEDEDPGGEWARVRKGDVVGFVRADHLRYYMRTDPYGPYVPGVIYYPYAAHVLEPTDIYDNETGELLRTVPENTILSVSALDMDMAVTLPYDRTTGRIQATANLEMEVVVPWDEAQMGDLIAVFSTYYDPAQDTQEQIGRLHNIMQGVERLNDVIIPAGEKFYFNDYCAPYTKSNGYELGPIVNYVSSEKLGYGGGICQVSTTLYNAILQIPIGIIKWQVHSSYGISYAPLDMDAAVGAGNIDLRLQNTLPYDVRMALQATGGVLTVRMYRAS